jgi:protocadherin alpha
VQAEILDINDNTPAFPVPSKSIEISEATEPDASFLLPLADDLDSVKYGIVRYEIQPPTSVFDLLVVQDDLAPAAATAGAHDEARGISFRMTAGAAQLRLVLTERVDRETVDYFRFAVVAIDAGSPVRSGMTRK